MFGRLHENLARLQNALKTPPRVEKATQPFAIDPLALEDYKRQTRARKPYRRGVDENAPKKGEEGAGRAPEGSATPPDPDEDLRVCCTCCCGCCCGFLTYAKEGEDGRHYRTEHDYGDEFGSGVETMLLSFKWVSYMLLVMTVFALPFWIMVWTMDGFTGERLRLVSEQQGAEHEYMFKNFPFNMVLRHGGLWWLLRGLSFAAISEDKDDSDVISIVRFGPYSMSRDTFLFVIAFADVVAVCTLLLMRFYYVHKFREHEEAYDSRNLEMCDFTILAKGLGPYQEGVDPERDSMDRNDVVLQLQEYYAKRIRSLLPDTKDKRDEDIVHNIVPITSGQSPMVKTLRRMFRQGRMLERIHARAATTGEDLSGKIAQAEETFAAVQERAAHLSDNPGRIVDAFIIFRKERYADELLGISKSNNLTEKAWQVIKDTGRLGKERNMRKPAFQGKYTPTERLADAPDDYIYENLGKHPTNVWRRRTLSTVIMVALTLAAISLVAVLRTNQRRYMTNITIDPDALGEAIGRSGPYLQNLPDLEDASFAAFCPNVLQACEASPMNELPAGYLNMTYKEYLDVEPYALLGYYVNQFLLPMVTCLELPEICDKATWKGETEEALQVACVTCHCHGLSLREMTEHNEWQSRQTQVDCDFLAQSTAMSTIFSVAISVTIAVMNLLLGLIILALVNGLERHETKSEQDVSLCRKLFVAQFLNTVISPLLANAEIRWLSLFTNKALFTTGFHDFTVSWYATAGAETLQTLFIVAFIRRLVNYFMGILIPSTARALTTPYTQEHANLLTLNGMFIIGRSVAETCVNVTFAFTFGLSIPVMYPIMFAAMWAHIADDKFKLVRMWRMATRYASHTVKDLWTIMRFAIYLHVCVSAWMISYFRSFDQIVATPSATEAASESGREDYSEKVDVWLGSFQRIFQFFVWPYVLLLLVIITIEILCFFGHDHAERVSEALYNQLCWALGVSRSRIAAEAQSRTPRMASQGGESTADLEGDVRGIPKNALRSYNVLDIDPSVMSERAKGAPIVRGFFDMVEP